MNAINFIKHYGLNTAIRIIEDSKNDDFWDTETAFYTDKNSESCVCLSELKRLVESVDLIKKHGGLFSTKCQLDKGGSDYEWYGENGDYGLTDLGDLEQAIADYESIYSNDMGDDTHIENHISPLCKTESQPVLIVEMDNQIIERLKAENVVLQAKVDELQVENKILNQAAATHLRNQNHFMDLYNRLVEQLYPYAIDLEEPVDGDVNITSQEFINGYNRARECAHYNLLEMMESDEEYIRAQCGMLGEIKKAME